MSLAARSLANAAQMHQSGKLREAVEVYKFALSQATSGPDRARVQHMMAIALGQQGLVEDSLRVMRDAVASEPEQTGFREELAMLLVRFGRHEEAVETLREAVRLRPSAVSARVHLGNELVALRRVEEALVEFRAAVEREPNNPMAHHALGFIAERMGDLDEARAHAERCLQASPGHVESLILLARIFRRRGDAAMARAILERLLSTGQELNAREGGRALIEMGFVLDAMEEPDQALQAFGAGKQALFSLMSPRQRDRSLATLTLERCRQIVSAQRIGAWADPPADTVQAPIFLVGYPRSGTTLLEQILAAHPHLCVTGEDPVLYRVKARIPELIGANAPYPEALDDLTPAHLTALRAMYQEEARNVMGPALEGRRLVEKHPLVIIDLPLVRRLFPESPVLVLLRDPRDTCISCFMQDFDRGTPHYYDLTATAEHYDLTMDLWLHYKQALLGLKYLEFRYEDLCADPETWARKTLEFLGEPWADSVLRYFERPHRRYVTTPSYADVMKPVYTASIGRWKKYEQELSRSFPRLDRYIDEFGYR